VKDLQTYLRPETAEEAVRLKRGYGPQAVYLGGASDLLVHRPRGVTAAIDIRHAGISDITRRNGMIAIGGGALLRDVELSLADVARGMLRTAVRETAPWLIRNAATLAGNVANASPAADSVPALLALDARLGLRGEWEEEVEVADVLLGPHNTTLGDRLIVEIRIPERAAARRGAFIKFARSKSDIAQVNIAVTLRLEGGLIHDVRVALGAVAPTAVRARAAEAALEGRPATEGVLREAAEALRGDTSPISDWRASAEYRSRVSAVLLRRAVLAAAAENGNGAGG
jgi:CO/xanthine dehydrogenase FAD-binding subunit